MDPQILSALFQHVFLQMLAILKHRKNPAPNTKTAIVGPFFVGINDFGPVLKMLATD